MRKTKVVVRIDEDALNWSPQDTADRIARHINDETDTAGVEVRLVVRPMKKMAGLHHGTKEYVSTLPARP